MIRKIREIIAAKIENERMLVLANQENIRLKSEL
jgi:hypothetical protein